MSSSIPPPALNGGLYTGEPFKGPWGNVPVVPDTDYMINVNLRSARPPPEALTQYPGGPRPGNNVQKMPGVRLFDGTAGVACQDSACPAPPPPKPSWAKYASW
jgi:hypothetical protein